MAVTRDKIKEVTKYESTCALASGTDIIVAKLLATPDELLVDAPLFAWQQDFIKYYHLPKTTSLLDLKKLFALYPNPQDQQIILGPVLRVCLQRLISEDADNIKQKLYESTQYGLRKALKRILLSAGSIIANELYMDESNNIYKSNEAQFKKAIADYKAFCADKKLQLNAEASFTAYMAEKSFENDKTVEAVILDYWLNSGAKKYALYIGKKNTFLDVAESAIVLNHLGISVVEVTANAKFQYSASSPNALVLEVAHNGHGHWEAVAATAEEATRHNKAYHSANYLQGLSLEEDAQTRIRHHLVASFTKISSPVSMVPASTPAKIQWQTLIVETQKASVANNNAVPADGIQYHYIRDNKTHSFWVSKPKQEELDKALALAIQEDANLFDSLPKRI